MRYAVISDVHANLPALRAVLADADRRGVEGVLCLGDVVGYGPWPDECIDALVAAQAVCVAGNHDLIAVGGLPGARTSALASVTLDWTAEVLAERSRTWLRSLPLQVLLDDMLLAHGSPEDPQEYVRDPKRAAAVLSAAGSEVVLLGHTHTAVVVSASGALLRRRPGLVRTDGTRFVLNPGSVGQSRERSPDARYAVLDRCADTIDLRAVTYDASACAKALADRGLPPGTYHCAPPVHRRAVRALLDRVPANRG